MASSAVATTLTQPIDLIVVVSATGKMPRFVAKYKPAVPVLTASTDLLIAKNLSVVRGVIPLLVNEDQMNTGSLIAKA